MKYEIGQLIIGKVTKVKPFALFLEFEDGTSGLLHISEISNDFVKDVSKVAKVDDILYAKVLDIDHKLKQLKLSIKAINPKVRYKTNFVKVGLQ